MIEIQIAGAGAGKTYSLAQRIVEKIKSGIVEGKVYALTFTNTAKDKIHQEVMKQNGSVPENVIIETVHSFFLNEIIFPFSSYTIGEVYSKASIQYLGSNIKYKQKKIKDLKDNKIIHAEKVYSITKKIIDKEVSVHTSKKKKKKVDFVLSILHSCIDSILVDEVQDMNQDALRVFEVLGLSNITVYMIGDPKQAIRYPKAFIEFYEKFSNEEAEKVCLLEINNKTRRIPSQILEHSNRFCYAGQKQVSMSKIQGKVTYIESTHKDFELFFELHIMRKSIICIDKRSGNYSTGNDQKFGFPYTIEEKLKSSKMRKDKDEKLFVKATYSEFRDNVKTLTKNELIKTFINSHGLALEKSEFAQLYALVDSLGHQREKYVISSIDAVKGLEADTSIFILTPNMLNYFLQENLTKKQKFNKEWKRVYVALTRAKQELIFVLDHDLLKDKNIDEIKASLEALGVSRFK